MSSPDCQRTKCGAKNFLRTPICLYSQNYFLGTVEDQFEFIEQRPHLFFTVVFIERVRELS